MRILFLGALALAILAPGAALAAPDGGAASGLPPRPVMTPVASCASLAGRDFTDATGLPMTIVSAEIEPANGRQAEFCEVKGYIAPQVKFELRLPTTTYTGRYLQGGCGGACGQVDVRFSPDIDNQLALAGAFALGFNDSGHASGSAMDTFWAAGDPALRADFAYRASHVNAIAAKAVIAAYYGRPPAISYFDGCSNGGREALMEVQRFPEDFSGIIAGAPAVWITPGVVRILWESRVATGADGQPILTPSAVQVLHAAVLHDCDGLDGLEDGQIDDARACHFDPRSLICRPGQAADQCLTAEEAEVAEKLYQGPVDDAGHRVYLGGEPYGSELTWVGPGSFTSIGPTLAAKQIKYMIFGGAALPGFDWRTWKLDGAALHSLLVRGGYYDTSSGDVAGFRRAGGKLILWQGAADGAAGPNVLLDYYQRVRDASGGLDAARAFARSFIIPGVYHCGGGYMPYQASLLAPLVSWVETGAAPDKIDANAVLPDAAQRSRPVYAYPVRARYRGTGSINDAASFTAAEPAHEPDDHFHWLGDAAAPSVEAAPDEPSRDPGAATGDLHLSYLFPPTGETVKYRLYVPPAYDGSRAFPLVVILHGFSGDENAAFDEPPPPLKGVVQQQADRHSFIVLSPAGYDGKGDYGAHLPLPVHPGVSITHSAREDDLAAADVMDVVRQVEQTYKIDPRSVYLMGNSMGMTGTLQLAQKFQEQWCAIGPSDGPPWPAYPADRLKGLSGAVFVNGDRDNIALTATNRALADRVRSEGVDVTFLEVPEGEHATAWYMRVAQMFDFFAAHPCRN